MKPFQRIKTNLGLVILTAVISIALTVAVIASFGTRVSGKSALLEKTTGHDIHDHDENNPLWTCGMHPWIVTEASGLCPICNMELTPIENKDASVDDGEREIAYWNDPDDEMKIYASPDAYQGSNELTPVYEDQLIGGVNIQIDPVIEQNMGIRTAKVETGPWENSIRTYGNITYDETRTFHFSLKFSGWIETLYADYTGRHVKKGDPLFEIYSPELFSAQEEYLSAVRAAGKKSLAGISQIGASARQRLENFGIHEKEIKAIEETQKISKHLIVRSPYTGVITLKTIAQGTFIKAGAQIFTISDLSRIWVEGSIFEYEIGNLEIGQQAIMESAFLPGQVFTGKVSYIYPYLEKKTRDVLVRLEFDNPHMALKPDMYVNVTIQTTGKSSGMIIDSHAVIRSGDSNLVFVTKHRGRFIPRKVVLGMALDHDKVAVMSGLAPGETIVTSGQFLLDSESKLKEAIQKMVAPKKAAKIDPPAKEDDFFSEMEPKKEDAFFDDM